MFDRYGGFYFTDPGKVMPRTRDRGAVFYAKTDGSFIKQVIYPIEGANGIGISPDDSTSYVAESPSGRIWAYELIGPGEIRRVQGTGAVGARPLRLCRERLRDLQFTGNRRRAAISAWPIFRMAEYR